MSNTKKTVLILLVGSALWFSAVLVTLAVVKAAECHNWQNRPLDQVSRRCLK